MIENIQRDDLNAPEIAAFIANRLELGDSQADISRAHDTQMPRSEILDRSPVEILVDHRRADV